MGNLGQPIAVGRTAEVYRFEDGKVLKLFFPTISRSWIDKEIDTGRYIQGVQLPVPKVYERVRLNDREGVVYEKVEGPSLLNQLAVKPWKVVQYARLLASLHAQVHQVPAPMNLETQREWARGGIPETGKLSKVLRESVLHLLDSMLEGNRLCHGDFHPGNIVVTHRGPVIIDWMTASKGTACGDVARTSIILEVAKAPEGMPMRWLLERIRKVFLATYLKSYFQLHPVERNSFTGWRAIMAANFLADVSLPAEEANLAAIVEYGMRSMEGGQHTLEATPPSGQGGGY
jgi:aminoglycoside phosphotransferase (APT) family kinase protein